MELKEKWQKIVVMRYTDVNLEDFSLSSDIERYRTCVDVVRETAKLNQLMEEIEGLIEHRKESLRNMERRFSTAKQYCQKGRELFCAHQHSDAFTAFNKAISASPLAVITRSCSTTCGCTAKEPTTPCSCDFCINWSAESRNGCDSPRGSRRSDRSESNGKTNHDQDCMRSYRHCLGVCFALRGYLLLASQQAKAAERDFRQCLALHPQFASLAGVHFYLAEALTRQGDKEGARTNLCLCLENSRDGTLDEHSLLGIPSADDIQMAIVSLDTGAPQWTEAEQESLPTLAQKESNAIAYGSDLIKVNFTEEKGRFLEANGPIKAGDALIVEPPFASVLLPEYYNTHCYNCLDPIVAMYPCMQCENVRFCSSQCSEEAWNKYHRFECQIWPLIEMVDALTHLSIRSLLVARKEEILDIITKFECSRSDKSCRIPGLSTSGLYQNDYRAVYHLVTNSSMQPKQALFSFSLTASVVAPFLSLAFGFAKSGKDNMENLCNKIRNSVFKNKQENLGNGKKIVNVNSIAEAFARLSTSKMHERSKIQSRSLDEESFLHSTCASGKPKLGTNNRCHSFDSLFHSRSPLPANMSQCALADMHHDEGLQMDGTHLGVLLLRHLQQMSCNVFAVTKLVAVPGGQGTVPFSLEQSRNSKKEPRRIAVAIYPTACLLNHSCDPDVIVSFVGKHMVVRATHNILPGEEITHCYGPHVGQMIRAARQKMLQNQYYFTCRCGACRRDEEMEREQLCLLSLLCPVCRGVVKVSYKGDTYVGSCTNPLCGNIGNVTKELQKFQETKEDLIEALNSGRQGDNRKSLTLLQAVLRKRSSILHSRDKYVAEVHDALARCFAILGDWGLASYHCSLRMETVEHEFGSTSLELAHELHRLLQFLIRGRYTKKAMDVVDRGIELLSLHYGKDYPEVQKLVNIKQCLRNFNTPVAQFVI